MGKIVENDVSSLFAMYVNPWVATKTLKIYTASHLTEHLRTWDVVALHGLN